MALNTCAQTLSWTRSDSCRFVWSRRKDTTSTQAKEDTNSDERHMEGERIRLESLSTARRRSTWTKDFRIAEEGTEWIGIAKLRQQLRGPLQRLNTISRNGCWPSRQDYSARQSFLRSFTLGWTRRYYDILRSVASKLALAPDSSAPRWMSHLSDRWRVSVENQVPMGL